MASALDRLLVGAVDLHYHSAPSPFPRRLDAAEAARHYEEAGFRAAVMKSHHHSTVFEILALQSTLLSSLNLEVFGGIALNGTVGGLNPRAVELTLKMGGRIVWFPTMSSAAHIEYHQQHHDTGFPTSAIPLMPEEPIDVFGPDGDLKPEVHQIIGMIRDANAILASGHMNPQQVDAVFTAAKAAGVTKLLVNHPDFVLGISHEQARRLADMGVYIEHSIGMYNDRSATPKPRPISQLLEWIEVVGPEQTTLGSDVGQKANPLPVDTFRRVSELLLDSGIHERDLKRMISTSPASLLGLDGGGAVER